MNQNNLPPKRKNIRIDEYDYSQEGMYFITICIKNKEYLLSKIIDNGRGVQCTSAKTQTGKIIEGYISLINNVYPSVYIDEYVIMPNHIHMVIQIVNKNTKTISNIIQQMKGKITKELGHNIFQKSFYEHVIRNEYQYLKIKEYIINNPMKWREDKYYLPLEKRATNGRPYKGR